MSIAEFLTARLDEDERVARVAASRDHESWAVRPADGPPVAVWSTDDRPVVMVSGTWVQPGEHIARHDPARVLADVAAKRAILAPHRSFTWSGPDGCERCSTEGVELVPWPCPTVVALAQPYADHPDFDSAWRSAVATP